mmetsp:Transcript_25640/g.84939  ORF Transcript_25640/g.84939 Transcript_25640/m.84939 type:complete len:308 (-) Transcript_25640:73-996(-)
MVELAVERLELGKVEVRDGVGVAAAVDAVGVVREEGLLRRALHERVRGRVDALHFVVHDARVRELRVAVDLVVPALLLEHGLVGGGARVEDGVEVDARQVPEVLEVLRRDGVARPVRVREGVEERLQRALEQLDEGLLRRVVLAPAEHTVLEDVGQARRVARRSAERDAEDLVVVVRDDGEHLGLGRDVLVDVADGAVLVDGLGAHEAEGRVRGRRGRLRGLGGDGRRVARGLEAPARLAQRRPGAAHGRRAEADGRAGERHGGRARRHLQERRPRARLRGAHLRGARRARAGRRAKHAGQHDEAEL